MIYGQVQRAQKTILLIKAFFLSLLECEIKGIAQIWHGVSSWIQARHVHAHEGSYHAPITHVQEQEENYSLLLRLQAEILTVMKDGVSAKDVYNHALAFFRKHKPDLTSHIPKNAGFLVRFSK
jgi:hypothetical protein